MGDIAKNFNRSEFLCHCSICAEKPSRPSTKIEVINALQAVRDIYGKPIRVTRGVSCAAHNVAVGGARDSRHLEQHADAVDLAYNGGQEAFELVAALIEEGRFTVIIVYPHHIHADMRPGARRFLASPGLC